MQLMNDLDFKTAVEEIKTAAKWLRDSGSPKVSLILCIPSERNT